MIQGLIELVFRWVLWWILAYCLASVFSFVAISINAGLEFGLTIDASTQFLSHIYEIVTKWTQFDWYLSPVAFSYIIISGILFIAHEIYFDAITTSVSINVLLRIFHSILWPIGLLWHLFFYRSYYFQFLKDVGHADAKPPYYYSVWSIYGLAVIGWLISVLALFSVSSV